MASAWARHCYTEALPPRSGHTTATAAAVAVVNPERPTGAPEIGEWQLRFTLDGVRFPAQKWQLLAGADYNGAALPIRLAVWRLPEQMYRNLNEVVRAINTPRDEPGPALSSGPSAPSSGPPPRPGLESVVRALATRKRPSP
jgi:hypothetical protein